MNYTRYFHLPLLLLFLFTTASCDKFLEEFSQDEVVPKDVNEYSEILFGEAYFKDDYIPFHYIDLMTDDVKAEVQRRNSTGTDTRTQAFGYFTWQEQPEYTPEGGVRNDLTWQTLYGHILTANVILDAMDGMTGSPSLKAQLKGECHAARLYAYLILVNLYAPHYDSTTAATTPGVPLNRHSYAEDTQFPRASVEEVYQEMEHDLSVAMNSFVATDVYPSIFRWNRGAVAVLGSRLHLYKREYEKAIEYATTALRINPSLYDLNKKQANPTTAEKSFHNKDNTELLFTFGFWRPAVFSDANLAFFGPSDELLSIFTEGDQRYYDGKGAFITRERKGSLFGGRYWVTSVKKTAPTDESLVYGQAIRTAEALLNRAEAYAELGRIEEARADLITLARARYATEHLPTYEATTKEEIIAHVRLERRKELLFEHHRWFDLRRWHQPELKHQYITNIEDGTTEEYILHERDPRYTLPIPEAVRLSDPSLTSK